MADLVHKKKEDFTKGDWIRFLKIVEGLGGSASLRKSIDSGPKRPPFRDPHDFPNFTGANLNSGSAIIVAFVNINTADGHTGTGWAFGFGAGLEVTGGVLGYSSWDQLMSGPNAFVVGSVEAGVGASFFIDGTLVATYLGSGVELDVSLNGGSFTWT
ncbi:uncharacterized protein GGS22DRAFT_188777 [Annulohypoxylon maeteangense]|uniref:uncharacterized protein n=1 Tax=Annulohypoxylon maeteangense TaxID=1927788 RepID=UPI0020081BDD|nr:uncharacterized protein GGS22DRAFT_188777 [Annulohypoxylon maeteangense]KAI0884568.1 hypothetical protein GGS22DRAFT_188777 [Annulohypoxylon maeteangense]